MTTFDERKDGFEKKFVHDEDLKFKAEARRNRMLGQWAADKLGKSGDEAAAYAKSVIEADFQEAGDADVLRKVAGDLAAKGIGEAEVRAKMAELLATAVEQIKSAG
ncbi:DUF1476 domain-containing protein [Bradyrhizobium sp. WD16]|uniref:DUF1476 domain-containing protein n=1 Tax=Bradyrhizobium sp. WD16 TaxID=1521768 RepID=UPI0020A4024A|nr:DUF1476 domain-containing protein [Bradyrhizobium sp. WD16]UTD28537.1 DUF1476 domain-containing protein [Bradyrhizobium sp. WD16]